MNNIPLKYKIYYLGWDFDWASGDTKIQNTDKYFLFSERNDSSITYVTYDSDEDAFFNNDESDEALLVHPKQLKFLKNLRIKNELINDIISNSFYFKRDTVYLNAVLNKKEIL